MACTNKLKEIFYMTTIRSAMTYEAEYWPIKKQHMHKMSVIKMRMLMSMCGKLGKIELEMSGLGSI